MGKFYIMEFVGGDGYGAGALHVGESTIVGADVTGATYLGTFENVNGSLSGNVEFTSAGGQLVTGMPIPIGIKLPIKFSVAQDFGNGSPVNIFIAGQPVQVKFRLVGTTN